MTYKLIITLKVTKSLGFTLSLEDKFLEKSQGGDDGVKLTSPPSTQSFKG